MAMEQDVFYMNIKAQAQGSPLLFTEIGDVLNFPLWRLALALVTHA
jgi:hypothetical protein